MKFIYPFECFINTTYKAERHAMIVLRFRHFICIDVGMRIYPNTSDFLSNIFRIIDYWQNSRDGLRMISPTEDIWSWVIENKIVHSMQILWDVYSFINQKLSRSISKISFNVLCNPMSPLFCSYLLLSFVPWQTYNCGKFWFIHINIILLFPMLQIKAFF